MKNKAEEAAQKARRISWIIGVLLVVSASVVSGLIFIFYQVQMPVFVDSLETPDCSEAKIMAEMMIDGIVRYLVVWIFILWMASLGSLVFFLRIVRIGALHKQ